MSSSNTLDIVKKLKEENQDFEWYPTTQQIIQKVKECVDFDRCHSMLVRGEVFWCSDCRIKYKAHKSLSLLEIK